MSCLLFLLASYQLPITLWHSLQPGGNLQLISLLFLYTYNEVRKNIFKISKWLLWSKGLQKNATWFLNSFEDLSKVLSEDWYRKHNGSRASEQLSLCSPWDSRGDGNQSDNCYSS